MQPFGEARRVDGPIADGPARIRQARKRTRYIGPEQVVGRTPVTAADFTDVESQRVFDAAAGAVACELGRQAGREWFDFMAGKGRG